MLCFFKFGVDYIVFYKTELHFGTVFLTYTSGWIMIFFGYFIMNHAPSPPKKCESMIQILQMDF